MMQDNSPVTQHFDEENLDQGFGQHEKNFSFGLVNGSLCWPTHLTRRPTWLH